MGLVLPADLRHEQVLREKQPFLADGRKAPKQPQQAFLHRTMHPGMGINASRIVATTLPIVRKSALIKAC
jgi:hypothetical protein